MIRQTTCTRKARPASGAAAAAAPVCALQTHFSNHMTQHYHPATAAVRTFVSCCGARQCVGHILSNHIVTGAVECIGCVCRVQGASFPCMVCGVRFGWAGVYTEQCDIEHAHGRWILINWHSPVSPQPAQTADAPPPPTASTHTWKPVTLADLLCGRQQ